MSNGSAAYCASPPVPKPEASTFSHMLTDRQVCLALFPAPRLAAASVLVTLGCSKETVKDDKDASQMQCAPELVLAQHTPPHGVGGWGWVLGGGAGG